MSKRRYLAACVSLAALAWLAWWWSQPAPRQHASAPPPRATEPATDEHNAAPTIAEREAGPEALPAAPPEHVPSASDWAHTRVVGRVVDGAHAGLPGARVTLVAGRWVQSVEPGEADGETHRATVLSDADGAFVFDGVAAAAVEAELEARLAGTAPATRHVAKLACGGITSVGELVLAVGAVASGVVLDETRRPVASARIRCERLGDTFDRDWDTAQGEEVGASDELGRFTVEHLPAQLVRLCAVSEGHAARWSAPLALTEGVHVDDLKLSSPHAVTLTGRVVECATDTGIAAVLAVSGNHVCVGRVHTAEDGSFTVAGLVRDEDLWFGVSADDYVYSSCADGSSGGGNVLLVDAERLAAGWRITMQRCSLGVLQVVDARTRAPLADAELARMPDGAPVAGGSRRLAPPERVLARADGAGRIDYRGPLAARGMLQVQASGYLAKEIDTQLGASAPERVVELEAARALRVDVVAPASARAGIVVELHANDERARWTGRVTPANAGFALLERKDVALGKPAMFRGVGPAKYLVAARGDDGWIAQREVQLEERDSERQITLVLAPPASLVARVDCAGLDALPCALVAVDEHGYCTSAAVSADGAVEITGLAAGTYTALLVRANDDADEIRVDLGLERRSANPPSKFVLAAGERRELAFAGSCTRGALHGRVTINGAPARSREVSVEWLGPLAGADPPPWKLEERHIWSDAGGEFRVEGLDAGRWRAQVRGNSDRTHNLAFAASEVTIEHGSDVELALDAHVGEVSLRWLDQSGAPLHRHLPVMIQGEIDGVRCNTVVLSDGSGLITLAELPAARWHFETLDSRSDKFDRDVLAATRNEFEFTLTKP